MPYPVQNLIEDRGEPLWIRPDESAQRAWALMNEHDFSQLPVVDEEKRPLGIITHESILRAHTNFDAPVGQLLVSDAIVKAYTYRAEDDLFELLDRLRDTYAVLIVDGDNKLIGIVTSYDSTEYFRRRVEDMMLVEDIENMIKDLIQAAFMDETSEVSQAKLDEAIEQVTSSKQALVGRYRNALKHYLKRQGEAKINQTWFRESLEKLAPQQEPRAFDELTLYEYTELLLHRRRWDFYKPFFKLEPQALRKLLDGVRETRNALAHFRGEISRNQRDQLRFCSEWLAQHQVPISVSWPTYAAERPKEHLRVGEVQAAYTTTATGESAIIPTDEVLGPGDSRYAPLAIWLQSQPSNQSRVQLSFVDVEEIIDADLPASARKHRSWWANDPVDHPQSQQWLDVGWRVGQISITDEKVTFARIKEREAAYIAFFSVLQKALREDTDFPLRELSPDGQSWQTATSLPEDGLKCVHFTFSFARGKRLRVELYIDTENQAKNKYIFDRLFADRDNLERALGQVPSWERLDEKRASRIALYHPGAITDDEETLAQLRTWAAEAMVAFYETFAEPVNQALSAAEQTGD